MQDNSLCFQRSIQMESHRNRKESIACFPKKNNPDSLRRMHFAFVSTFAASSFLVLFSLLLSSKIFEKQKFLKSEKFTNRRQIFLSTLVVHVHVLS